MRCLSRINRGQAPAATASSGSKDRAKGAKKGAVDAIGLLRFVRKWATERWVFSVVCLDLEVRYGE